MRGRGSGGRRSAGRLAAAEWRTAVAAESGEVCGFRRFSRLTTASTAPRQPEMVPAKTTDAAAGVVFWPSRHQQIVYDLLVYRTFRFVHPPEELDR